jgi:hypothetical protein
VRPSDFRQAIHVLVKHRVDFIVVGGVAAVLQGAPINTFDLDVVHSRDAENLPRILAALAELDAVYRLQPERKLRPNESHLVTPGHQLLTRVFGYVDFRGTIGHKQDYRDLREKDKIALPTLRSTLEERNAA